MLKHQDFESVQFRLAAFTPTLHQLSAAQIVSALLERFSGDPMVLPIPAGAPPEIPRIILREPRDAMELQIALSRSDLTLNRQPGVEFVATDLAQEGTAILEELLDVLTVRPGRLAAIGSYANKCDDPAAQLADHFTKPQWSAGPLADLKAFEVHAHRRLSLIEGLTVNSWIRCKTGSVSELKLSHPAVVIERDVNTLAEEVEQREFTPDEVNSFMKQAAVCLRTEIEELFPAEG